MALLSCSPIVVAILLARGVTALSNGLGQTPQMGWNSWNHFGCNVNETLIRSTVDAMVNNGFVAAGYNYLNVDDCWAGTRNSAGQIVADATTFPNGMAALATYAHSKGLKFGLYSDAGYTTCAGRPASLGYETQDAASYTAWGIDYLKYDNCNTDGTIPELRYPVMREAITSAGGKIFFSMCEWGVDNPALWAPTVGNSWRTTGDIQDNWASMIGNADDQVGIVQFGAPGGWNDPDMLEVGNGGMTVVEDQTHFALWAAMKAPLLIGADVTSPTAAAKAIYQNKEVIAINQDPLGVSASLVRRVSGSYDIWGGPLAGGDYVALIINRGTSTLSITLVLDDLMIASAALRDVIAAKDLGTFSGTGYTTSLASHASTMLKLTGVTLVSSTTYEAEAATLAGAAAKATCAACSGGYAVGYIGDSAGNVTFHNIQSSSTASRVSIYFLNGDVARSLTYSSNGGASTTINLPSTGSFVATGSFNLTIPFTAGSTNTLLFYNSGSYAPDLDRIVVWQ